MTNSGSQALGSSVTRAGRNTGAGINRLRPCPPRSTPVHDFTQTVERRPLRRAGLMWSLP